MYIDDAQQDFRRAYVGGGPGVLVSGLVRLAAASAAQSQGIGRGFAVLFIGGMIIHPVSTVLCRTPCSVVRRKPLGTRWRALRWRARLP